MSGLIHKLLLATCLLAPAEASPSPELLTLFNTKEFNCLVKNIYFESRGEPIKGQEAVALVTLNRVKSSNYPNTVCKNVYAPKQFSWVTNKTMKVRDRVSWAVAEDVAYRVLTGNHGLGHFKATHFHSTSVSPKWGLKRVAKIGQHIFYK